MRARLKLSFREFRHVIPPGLLQFMSSTARCRVSSEFSIVSLWERIEVRVNPERIHKSKSLSPSPALRIGQLQAAQRGCLLYTRLASTISLSPMVALPMVKKPLIETNPYLINPTQRQELFYTSVTSSTAIEGVHVGTSDLVNPPSKPMETNVREREESYRSRR